MAVIMYVRMFEAEQYKDEQTMPFKLGSQVTSSS